MTLQEWSDANDILYDTLPKSRAVSVVIDILDPARPKLWHLSDYRVSSVSGVVVWLMPK